MKENSNKKNASIGGTTVAEPNHESPEKNTKRKNIEKSSNDSLSVTLFLNADRFLSDENKVTKSIVNSKRLDEKGEQNKSIIVDMVYTTTRSTILNKNPGELDVKKDTVNDENEEGEYESNTDISYG